MKQKMNNAILSSRTSRLDTAIAVWLFVLCLLMAPLKPIALCKNIPLAAASSQSASKTEEQKEYEIKAAFIYNFMKFVEWPDNKSAQEGQEQSKTMVIGVLGKNPFGSAFVPIIGKEIKGREIRLVEIDGYHAFRKTSGDRSNAWDAYQAGYQEIIRKCDVLFICDSEKDYVTELLSLTSGNMILTIGDVSKFAEEKGIIGFIVDKSKLRFNVNLDNANKENIKIRAQLLKLAKKVYQK